MQKTKKDEQHRPHQKYLDWPGINLGTHEGKAIPAP